MELTLLRPGLAQLGLHQLAEARFADPVHEKLEPRLEDVLAQLIGRVEDANHRLRKPQKVVDRHKLGQQQRLFGHRRETAADHHPKAAHRFAVNLAHFREKRQVVDRRDRRVRFAPGEVDLELARQQLRNRVAHPVAHERARVGRRIEHLPRQNARPRIGRHVAHRVAAGLPRRQSCAAQHPEHVRHLIQRHEMQLDVLPRRDVPLLERREHLRRLPESVQLIGAHPAHRQLDPIHVHIGLPLAVDALPQPVEHELDLVPLLLAERRRLRLEIAQLVVQNRDHDARLVLCRLGNHARASRLTLPALHEGGGNGAVLQTDYQSRSDSSITAENADSTRSPRSSAGSAATCAAARSRSSISVSRGSSVRRPSTITCRSNGSQPSGGLSGGGASNGIIRSSTISPPPLRRQTCFRLGRLGLPGERLARGCPSYSTSL